MIFSRGWQYGCTVMCFNSRVRVDARIAFERRDGTDPDALGLVDVEQCVREARQEPSAHGWIDLAEAPGMFAYLGNRRLGFTVETRAELRADAGI